MPSPSQISLSFSLSLITPLSLSLSLSLSLMMKGRVLFSFKDYITIFLILHLAKVNLSYAETPPSFDACEPKTCGNFTITYPFWLNHGQQSYCGYPSFNLTCNGDHSHPLAANILGMDYYIKNIFYQNNSFQVTAASFVNENCPLPYFNYTSALYPLSLSNLNKEIYFLYCSASLYAYEKMDCFQYGNQSYFAGVYDMFAPPKLNASNGTCVPVQVPVVNYSPAKSRDYIGLLREGWLLDWNMPNCAECSASGGRCGYDGSNGSFMCICHDQVHKTSCRSSKKKTIIIAVAASVGLFILLGAIVLVLMYKKKMRKQSSSSKFLFQGKSIERSSKDPGTSNMHFKTHVFTYKELQVATNFFDDSRVIGDGGFGEVYKGNLKDKRVVAIKRLYENNYKRVEQFMNEVEILSRLRHPNLVNLYGCTSRHSRELLLVYEFVSNGTVADHLHGSRAHEAMLTWPVRLNIAIETANAFAYLHAVTPPIIHRDVKTNNILLDDSFHVKVADFGLSRLLPTDNTHISTAPQGTPGYLDPEYYQSYQLTSKSDVYSFGVVLMELISSKPAVDITRNRSEINLANMAIMKIQNGEIDQLVDPKLGYESNQTVNKMITMVAELAFRCLQTDGDMRPPIEEVLDILQAIESEGNKDAKDIEDAPSDSKSLRSVMPVSPDTVFHKCVSRSTTPNSSE